MRNFPWRIHPSVVLLQSTQTHYCSVVNKSGFKSLAACLRRLLTTWKHFAGTVNVLAKFFFLSFSFFSRRAFFSIIWSAHLKTNAWHASPSSCCRAVSHAEVLSSPVSSLGRWWQCWLCKTPPCYWQSVLGNYNLPSLHDLRGVRRDGIPPFFFLGRKIYISTLFSFRFIFIMQPISCSELGTDFSTFARIQIVMAFDICWLFMILTVHKRDRTVV